MPRQKTQRQVKGIEYRDAAQNGEKEKKQIEETTAESQSIVVQDNSNPYNTSPKLSRLQMILPLPHLTDVSPKGIISGPEGLV